MAETYYYLTKSPARNWMPYHTIPMDSEHPERGSFRSQAGVSSPGIGDYLIVPESGAPEIYCPSAPYAFADVNFLRFPGVDDLIASGTIRELTPDEKERFTAVRFIINRTTNELVDVRKRILNEPHDATLVHLRERELYLSNLLHRWQLELQMPETQRDISAITEAMQDKGFVRISPSFEAMNLCFHNSRTGQYHMFHSMQQAQDFLSQQTVAVTLYFDHTNDLSEEVQYFKGEEKAALNVYGCTLREVGTNAVRCHVALDESLDDLAYEMHCIRAEAFGEAPQSKTAFIASRELHRMEDASIQQPITTPALESGDIAAISYAEPNGEIVPLHFKKDEADTAVFTFKSILEDGQQPMVVVSPAAPDLSYALYRVHCDVTGAEHTLTKAEFMERYRAARLDKPAAPSASAAAPQAEDGDMLIGEGIPFERIRRITGYLVGDMNRFNNAKRAEVRDRSPHDTSRAPAAPRPTSHQRGKDEPEL